MYANEPKKSTEGTYALGLDLENIWALNERFCRLRRGPDLTDL